MQIFETEITVTEKDLDELNHVNNIRYVEWVNEVAKLHWEENTSEKIRNNYYWVIINHFIQYKSPAFLGDVVKFKTYVTKSQGVTSTRIVDMYLKNSERLIVTSETNWCLMIVKTNRPARITPEIANLFN